MKKVIIILILLLMPLATAGAVTQSDIEAARDELSSELDAGGLSGYLPPEAASRIYGVSPYDAGGWQDALDNMLNSAVRESGGALTAGLRSLLLILSTVIICGIVQGAREPSDVNGFDYVTLAGSLVIGIAALNEVNGLLETGKKTLESMKVFTDMLLPTMAAAAAASGQPTSAVAKQAATLLFADILLSVITGLIIPLLYGFLVLSIVNAAIGRDVLGKTAALLKWMATRILVLLLTAFVLYITVTGVLSGATDALTLKTTKAAVSGVVPVVGGVISEAAEAILAGSALLKASIGIFGLLAVLAVALTPFVRLGVSYLLYKIGAAAAGVVTDNRLCGLINDIGAALGLIVGMVGAGVFLIFVSILSMMRAVSL